jgi:nucleotide-binding universal stress UspA family protein
MAARLSVSTLISSPFVPAVRESVYRQKRRPIPKNTFTAPQHTINTPATAAVSYSPLSKTPRESIHKGHPAMFSAKRILSPIDFSDFSMQALAVAEDIAKRYDSELVLVHVVPVIPKLEGHADIFTEGEYENKLIASTTTRLADIVAKLQQKGLQARSTVSLSNDPAMEIMRVAESEKSDLIVIATHGTTGWRRLAFGSVTDKLVRNAECSVLVLRAPVAAVAEPASAAASASAQS